jgi:hypothetical protein
MSGAGDYASKVYLRQRRNRVRIGSNVILGPSNSRGQETSPLSDPWFPSVTVQRANPERELFLRLERYLYVGWQESVNVTIISDVFGLQVEVPGPPVVRARHFPV